MSDKLILISFSLHDEFHWVSIYCVRVGSHLQQSQLVFIQYKSLWSCLEFYVYYIFLYLQLLYLFAHKYKHSTSNIFYRSNVQICSTFQHNFLGLSSHLVHPYSKRKSLKECCHREPISMFYYRWPSNRSTHPKCTNSENFLHVRNEPIKHCWRRKR